MTEKPPSGIAGDPPRTVVELSAMIDRERGALEQAVSGMSEETFVDTSAGWSAKDHLAHVAAWERRLLGEVEGDQVAARFGLDEAAIANAETDVINAMIHARYRDDSPATVRAEFRAAGEALQALMAGMSDADLMRPVRPDDPMVDTLVDLIAWDTYRHYPDHVATIASLG
jgi:hypothetical protein